MNDYWVDGHFIAARSADEARAECESLYSYVPESVRFWTAEDQAD